MRGRVGVKNLSQQKMAEISSRQAFPYFYLVHASAHLTQQGFQLFSPLTEFLKWTMIRPFAQPHLENYIYIGFQPPTVEISNNPY